MNCGACGTWCDEGFACIASQCVRDCLAGETACGDSCVDVTSDRMNCGQCGTTCVGKCVNSMCESIAHLAAGSRHTCALTASGTVWCWGANTHGEVGDGTTTLRASPVQVVGLGNVTRSITAGSGFTCALDSLQRVLCFGNNGNGELGLNDTVDRTFPVVGPLYNVVGVTSGPMSASVFALRDQEAITAWGANGAGQLGDGTTTDRHAPVVTQLPGTRFAVGGAHACSLTNVTGDEVRCVGANNVGQLGDDGAESSSTTPVTVDGVSTAEGISAGSAHTCAVLHDGTAVCWGDNDHGQLGDGTTTTAKSPVVVSGLTNVPVLLQAAQDLIAAGGSHSCAVNDVGVVCWGSNASGQLGNGTLSDSDVPSLVTNLPHAAVQVVAGNSHTCALLVDHQTVMCWGAGNYGQLGNGQTPASASQPVLVE